MKRFVHGWQLGVAVLITTLCFAGLTPSSALAQATTGSITGTVTDQSGKPVADVVVTASSASQTAQATTNARGFFSLVNLTPETYTVSFQKTGYTPASVPGITVFQQQSVTLNESLSVALKTIATERASGASNLVKPNEGTNVYNITGQQLTAATNPVGTHETLYQWMAVTPGVTSNGFPSQPRIRGGQVTDLGYEFEGIPIQDRIVGFFTTNLSNIGLSNLEVYTGGLAGAGALNGTGYFNSVLKTGTYPPFVHVSLQATSPIFNNYLTVEGGWASPNHRYSAYVGFDGVNSENEYDYAHPTFLNVAYYQGFGYNGPGPVHTRDWVSNFHYRPNPKDDFQLVATNSLGEFVFDYLIKKSPGEPPALGFVPCPGAAPDTSTFTGASGGTAPNGSTCPTGLYWGALTNGTGNIYHHYGGLGKVQWNHNINENSFYSLRFAENFNQYIFDQPIGEINDPTQENGAYNWFNVLGLTPPPGTTNGCPKYPYAVGSPVVSPSFFDTTTGTVSTDTGDLCAFDDGVNNFWGDRRSNMWIASGDYHNVLSENITVHAGLSFERDNNVFQYYLTNAFTTLPSGGVRFPELYESSSYPTTQQSLYADSQLRFGKLMVDPGLTYGQRHYAFPADQGYTTVKCPTGLTCTPYGGGSTQTVLNPTFNGTYAFGPDDVLRFSYGNSSSFISSAYVYTSSESLVARNPFVPGTTFEPQLNHSADLMLEHNFGSNTTMRVGPFYNSTTNYYTSYRPFLGYFTGGTPTGTPCTPGTANCIPTFSKVATLTNSNRHNTLGAEFALNHIDNRLFGISWWVSATYDNYWTSAVDIAGAFVNTSLPQNIVSQGQLIRAASNPLWNATFLADFHSDRFHLNPLLYYQTDTFFNTGVTCDTLPDGTPVAPYICQNEQIAHGWWYASLTAYEELGPKRNFILGFKADNLFNNEMPTAPCLNNAAGTGCFPFDGPTSNTIAAPNSYIYQNNFSENPRLFYFFAGVRM